jgi:periplasmic divalent cation tolerance protein
VEESREWLLIIKTPSDRLEALMARIRSLHPYETPEIVSFSIEHGYPPYLEWVVAETRPSSHQD